MKLLYWKGGAMFPVLKIGDLEVEMPIIQGGMGVGISLSGLASAVANEGGIGVIATPDIGMDEPDFLTNFIEANRRALRKEIRKARELSKGIIGVNVMMALTNGMDLIRTAIEEEIDVIFLGAGFLRDPRQFIIKGMKTKIIPIVSSARVAEIIVKNWDIHEYLPDAVVTEGPKAGGHLGFKKDQINDPEYALEKIVPEVIEILGPYKKNGRPIPIIAAGGVFTGADIHKFLQLGAAGVQMATRFVATHECDADIRFKEAYINAKESDIVIIKSPVGMPGRAIRNNFLDEVSNGNKKPIRCPFKCLTPCKVESAPYCISFALMNAKKGNLPRGFAFAGANAYRVNEIVSVNEVFASLRKEYEDAEK